MKRVFILAVMVIFLCGCSNINKISKDKIIDDAINSKHIHTNKVKIGFSYYKPALMSVLETTRSNEVLRHNNDLYYLYVDTIAYYNKIENTYEENDISYYSKKIDHKNKSGYIEINEVKDKQYLIEIMYNYAKIEVMVDKSRINEAIAYSMSILSSIKYNDIVIKGSLGKDVFNTFEENVDIFKTKGIDKNTLKYVEDSRYDKDVIPDMDLVN